MTEKVNSKSAFILNIVFGAAGFFMIILLTYKWGIGLSPDSAGYMAAAKNILSGRGANLIFDSYGSPVMTWIPWRNNEVLHSFPWPPFYPLVLSVFGLVRSNLFEAGRFISAALFGANIFLVTFIARKYIKSFFLMVFAPVILLISYDMVQIHSMLWSEPLFIFLSLMGLVLLIDFLEKQKIYFLVFASLFFGLAFLTRTIGISLAGVAAVAVLFYSRLKLKRRIIYSALSVLICILPFSVWTLANKIIYGSSSGEIIYHPLNPVQYSKTINAISLWIMANKTPEKVRIIITAVLILVIIAVASFISIKNKKKFTDDDYKLNSNIISIFIYFILFYYIALLIARYFFNDAISIGDNRMLLPLLMAVFVVFLFFIKRFLDFYSEKKDIKILAYIFCAFLLSAALYNNNTIELYRNGHANTVWFNSETIKELKKIQQAQMPIYTNEPAVIYLFLERGAVILPLKSNLNTGSTNSSYKEDLAKAIEEIKAKNGMIVFFDRGWNFFPSEKEITSEYKLDLLKDTSDGAIYMIKK